MTFFEVMQTGGAIMWMLLALSVIALAVVIERAISFARSPVGLAELERALASSGDQPPAPGGRGGATSLLDAASQNWRADAESLRAVLELRAREEVALRERGLPSLDVIARVSPLLGLLGTVLGMVDMFRTLSLGGAVTASAVTGGIWKALFTTVAGLAVAIPVTIAHSLLSSRAARAEHELDRAQGLLLAAHARSRSAGADKRG